MRRNTPTTVAAALILGWGVIAIPRALEAQEGTIWNMEPSEEVTAVHEDDDSGEVGYVYVFPDEFFDYWPPLGPYVPNGPIAAPPEGDACAEALADYAYYLQDYFDALATLHEALASGQAMSQLGIVDGYEHRALFYRVRYGSPEWVDAIEELEIFVDSAAFFLDLATDAVVEACSAG